MRFGPIASGPPANLGAFGDFGHGWGRKIAKSAPKAQNCTQRFVRLPEGTSPWCRGRRAEGVARTKQAELIKPPDPPHGPGVRSRQLSNFHPRPAEVASLVDQLVASTETYRSANWVRDSCTAVPLIDARWTWRTIRSVGATSSMAAATARIVVSQFVSRNEVGIKAVDTRKAMRSTRMAAFRTTMNMDIGNSAGWRSGSLIAGGSPMVSAFLDRVPDRIGAMRRQTSPGDLWRLRHAQAPAPRYRAGGVWL